MRVQGADVPGFTMRGLPGVSAGPNASADSFGGGNPAIDRLGRAIQGFGEEVIRQDQIKRKEEDDTFIRNAINEAHTRYAAQSKAVYEQYKGQNSTQAPEEIGKLSTQIRGSISATLKNAHQQQGFSAAMDAFDRQTQIDALGYRDRQMEFAKFASLDAQNELIAQQAEANAAGATTPDGIAANRGRLQQIFDNVNQRFSGMPEEVKSLKRQEAAQVFHKGIMAAMDPAQALKYLDQDGVTQALGAAQTKALREKYQEADESAEITSQAMQFVDSGKGSDEAFKHAWARWPEDKAKREQFLTNYDNYERRKVRADREKKIAEEDAGWQELAKVGFDATRLPVNLRDKNPKLFRELEEYSAWLNEPKNAKLDPDLSWIDEKAAMLPSELRAYLAKNGYAELMRKSGGNMKYVNEIRDRSQMTDEKARGGGGSGGGSSGFNAGNWFEDAYSSIYPTRLYGVNTYLDGGNTAKRQRNGFILRFDERVRNGDGVWKGEEKEGRKPSDEDRQAIAMRLTTDAIQKRVNLDSTFYDEIKAREDKTRDMPVSVEELTPQEQLRVRNLPAISRENQDGQAARFGVLDVNTTDPTTGIFVDVKNAMFPPTEALIAADRGVYSQYGQSLAYEPGWHIVTFKNGDINTYDSAWNYKGQIAPPALERPQAAQAVTYPEPTKSQRILELEKQGYKFTWHDDANMWTGLGPNGLERQIFATGAERRGAVRYLGITPEELEEMRATATEE